MDVVTDLSSQCVSFITVFQEVCKEHASKEKIAGDSKSFVFFLSISNSLDVDTLVLKNDLKTRVEELVWASGGETIDNETLKCFVRHCKEIITWIDTYRGAHNEFRPANLYSSSYEWRSCMREILYTDREQRKELVRILRYMPIQVILSLGGKTSKLTEQRLLQIWQPAKAPEPAQKDDEHDCRLNLLSLNDESRKKEWWGAAWSWKLPEADEREDIVLGSGIRSTLAIGLLCDDRKILYALKVEENPVPFETLFIDELDEIVASRKIRWQAGMEDIVEKWETAVQQELDRLAASKAGNTPAAGVPGTTAAPPAENDEIAGAPPGKGNDPDDENANDPYVRARALKLYALALSGGGIRSATFNLGVIQKLAASGMLARFDYLSTVSGGGYIGSWLASWIQRNGSIGKVMDRLDPKKSANPLSDEVRPIRWLRMFSNYLSPNASIMSTDSWTMGVTWFRNTIINQVILLLLLCSVLALIRSVFLFWLPGGVIDKVVQWQIAAASFVVLFSGAFLAGWGMHAYNPEHPPKSLNLEKNKSYYIILMLWGIASTFLLSSWIYSHATGYYSFSQKLWQFAPAGVIGFFALWLVAYLGAYQKCAQTQRRPAEIYAFILLSSAIAAFCGALLLAGSWQLFETINGAGMLPRGFSYNKLAFIVGVPLILESISVTVVVRMAIMGILFPDLRREWWGRMGALIHRFTFIWLLVAFCALVLPDYLMNISYNSLGVPALFGGWSAIIGFAVKLAFGPKVSGKKQAGRSASAAEIFVKTAPYLFAVGVLILGSLTLGYVGSFLKFETFMNSGLAYLSTGILLGAVTFGLSWRVGVNEFSLHHFYRNRLSRAYLGATRRREDRDKSANSFTGFDGKDDLLLTCLVAKKKYTGPYPLINVTLNSTVVSDLDRQDRKAESFVFTPKYCGFDFCRSRPSASSQNNPYEYGYRQTGKYAYPDGPHLSTAMTISGAAVNPNMGYHSSASIAFLLTVFNVRLGWWMGNPRQEAWKEADPKLGIFYLINDLAGSSDINSDYVCLSDGGHFDNMGLYELIRRRCTNIVLCDAEEDENSSCDGLANAIRRCRIDFGVEIDIVVDPITKKDKKTKYSKQHLVKGTIWYPGDKEPSGSIIYIKTSLTGDEPVDIREYFMDNPTFPQQSTADQFFDESQFESYRKLGYSSIN